MKNRWTPFPAVLVEFGILNVCVNAMIVSTFVFFVFSLDFDQLFNLGEAMFWLAVAGAFAFHHRRLTQDKHLSIASVVAFAAFGVSDLIETSTRAWYQPPGLLAMKVGCVAAFLVIFAVYKRRKRSRS